MQLTFASYNIHKAVGTDLRRDPERIMAVLREIDADVIALQEVDRRFGERESVLPRRLIEGHSPWVPVPLRSFMGARGPGSLGWHGNALLLRRGIELVSAAPVVLPMLEPRGAVCAELQAEGQRFRVVGMHLDLSGLRRRQQIRAVLSHLGKGADEDGADEPIATVLMGDFNEWGRVRGSLTEFGNNWRVLAMGPSFPARRPLGHLDRIVASAQWTPGTLGVHHSALAARASDHLPVYARLQLPNI